MFGFIPGINFTPLAAGVLSAFNPCGVMLLPAYISYLMTHKTENYSKLKLLLYGCKIGILMTLGFVTIFVIIGLILSSMGAFVVNRYIPWLKLGIGIFFIIMGILLLIRPERMSSSSISKLGPAVQKKNKVNYYLYGVGYALVSLGCTLPVFVAMVFTSFALGNFQEGVISFILYSFSMGVVVTTITVLSLFSRSMIEKWIKKVVPYIHKIAGLFILLTGIYLIIYG